MKSFAIFALVYNVSAVKVGDPGDFVYWTDGRPSDFVSEGDAVKPLMYHWNEDPHSVPDPLNKRGQTFTSTQARYFRDGKLDTDTEVKDINVRYHRAYNELSPEPKNPTWYDFVQTSADSSSDSSDSEEENVQTTATTTVGNTVLWHVPVDYGELDDHVVSREADSGNGTKHGGWTNPLGWTDDGTGDEQFLQQNIDMVRAQYMSLLQYDESEGPTKADNGEDDDLVVGRVRGFNPLSWSDNGDDDDTVLTQIQSKYDESEGPTKADNGEDDDIVVNRVQGPNPLSWADNGADDDTVV